MTFASSFWGPRKPILMYEQHTKYVRLNQDNWIAPQVLKLANKYLKTYEFVFLCFCPITLV